MILAIETATPALSAAVVSEGIAVASATVRRRNTHDELLAPVLERLIEWAGIAPERIRGVAVSAGPGSFTGLRIGMAAAKGYALALGIPVVRVSTLEAIAHKASDGNALKDFASIAVLLEARGDDLYAAVYSPQGSVLHERRPAFSADARAIGQLLEEGAFLAGDGAQKLDRLFPGRFQVIESMSPAADAASVGRLGERLLDAGLRDDLASCEPFYVKSFTPTVPKSL